MRKISIPSQIVILFFSIVLVLTTVFSIITLSKMTEIAEKETYTRLLAFSTFVDSDSKVGEISDFRDMDVEYMRIKAGETLTSKDFSQYLSSADTSKIVERIDVGQTNQMISDKIENFASRKIYFVLLTFGHGQDYTIIATDSSYASNSIRSSSISIITVFILIIFLAFIVIGIWGNLFTKRLRKVKNHILKLPKTAYKTVYIDSGLDEIGDLSRAVEQMRKEIYAGERTKQEMLQNISHDFKTPISVIRTQAEAQIDGMADDSSSKVILAQTEKLKKKVNHLLEYNSLGYLKKDCEFEAVDMKDVILEVMYGYRFNSTVKIELDVEDGVYFKGYKENFITVVNNILDNALRYAKSLIKIVLKKNWLRIYNDGMALDEHFLIHGFRPYEKGIDGEFGLGMSIAKKTIDFFEMDLIVQNEIVGVSFIITKRKEE